MNNNLDNHEVIDTFYMTDEQLKKYQSKAVSKVRRKAVKKMLIGCGAGIALGAAFPLYAALLPGITVAIPMVASGIFGLSGMVKLMASYDEDYIRQINQKAVEEEEKKEGKVR